MGRWGRSVVGVWIAALLVLVVGQVPFAVEVGAAPDVVRQREVEPAYGSAGEVPGLPSVPLADPPAVPAPDRDVPEPLSYDPDGSVGDELDQQRTRFTRSFERSDGLVQVEVSSVPVAYETDGRFELIDTAVRPARDGALEAVRNQFGVRFGSSAEGVSVTLPSGKQIVSKVAALDGVRPGAAVAPVVDRKDRSVVWYRQVFAGVDLRYTVRASGLAEDIVYTRAPMGAGAVTFDVTGAELESVWATPAPESDGVPADGKPPAPVFTPAGSLGFSQPIGDPRSGGVELPEGLRVLADGERPDGARSGLRARGETGGEVSFGSLAVLTGGGSRWVADSEARPLARSAVTGPDRSQVEYSLDPGWLAGLDAEAFPVVLDPDLTVFSNGWRGYINGLPFECGSGSPWCWVQTGNPWQSGYHGSYWRSVAGFDLTSLKSSYGLGGSGSDRVKAAAVVMSRNAGSTVSTTIGVAKPTAWSWAGAVAGGSLASDTDTTEWTIGGSAVLSHVRSSVAGGTGVAFGAFSDTTSYYNHKESGIALFLVVDPSPPAPAAVSPSPADTKTWFARTPSSAPTLKVGAVSDANYKSPHTAMRYHFSVSTTPLGPGDYWGDVASRESTTSREFDLSAAWLRDGKTYWWRAWTNNGYALTPGPLYSFRYDRRLGIQHVSPMQQFGPMSVNAATGNGVFTWSSRTVNTLGGGASVSLAYNTSATEGPGAIEAAPGMPPGWTASWGDVPVSALDVTPGGSAAVRFTDGSKESFLWSGGRWTPDEALQYSILTSTGDSQEPYQWESPSGWVVNFDSDGNVTDATSPSDDTQPAALRYEWGTASGDPVLREVIDQVVSDGSRKMSFSYGGDPNSACPSGPPADMAVAPAGKLCKITHMDGSIIVFWYTTAQDQVTRIVEDGNGDLATGNDDQSVTDLAWGNGPAGGQLEHIRSPRANRSIAAGPSLGGFSGTDPGHTLDVAYDSEGRVDTLTGEQPDATHVRPGVDFDYPNTATTTVTDVNRSEPNGFTTRWTLDARGRATRVEDRQRRSTYTRWADAEVDQVSWTDTQSLDAVGQTVWMRSGTVYDDRGRPVQSWGPADRSEFDNATLPTNGTASGGAGTPLTETEYDTGLGGFAVAYWDNPDLGGAPKVYGYVPAALRTTTGSPDPAIPQSDGWSMRATGSVQFPTAGVWKLRSYSWGPTRLSVHDQFTDRFTSPDPGGGSYLTAEVTVNVTAAMIGKWYQVQLDTADSSGTGGFDLKWLPPGGSWGRVPVANVRPEFGLATRTVTRVDAATADVTVVSYDDPATANANESYLGIPRSTTVDPDPGGLQLTTTETFEAPGSGSFLRRTSRTLPAGAASKVTYEHYAPTDGPVAAVCGVGSGTDQLGLPKRTIQADPDGPGGDDPIVREYVYDSAGRQVGYRASTDVVNEPWTCTSFDDAGRVDHVDYPAWDGQPARTVTHDYAVGGNPTVTAISDPTGTITVTSDWAGRTVSYEDVWGLETTTGYDDLGRVTSKTNAGGTLGYSYGNDDQVTEVTFNGDVIAEPSYDSLTRMTGVDYPEDVPFAVEVAAGGGPWFHAARSVLQVAVTRSA